MSFLAFLLALAMYRFWGEVAAVQSDQWFHRWRASVSSVVSGDLLTLLLVLLPLMIAVHLLGDSIDDLFFGLPWIALAALLLVYAFGRGTVTDAMEQYRIALREGDFPVYSDAADERPDEHDEEVIPLPEELHRRNQEHFFYQDYQGRFALAFYFFVLGPAAALAYRLLHVYRESEGGELADTWLFYIDWVPARLLAASYAVTGDFVRSWDELLATLGDTQMEAGEVLSSVGIAALGQSPEPAHTPSAFGAQAARESEAVSSLMSRTAVAWMALLAIWVTFT